MRSAATSGNEPPPSNSSNGWLDPCLGCGRSGDPCLRPRPWARPPLPAAPPYTSQGSRTLKVRESLDKGSAPILTASIFP